MSKEITSDVDLKSVLIVKCKKVVLSKLNDFVNIYCLERDDEIIFESSVGVLLNILNKHVQM